MNRNTKITVSVIAIAAITRFAWRVSFEGSQAALEERFPDIDPTIVREVHTEMVREAFRGTHIDDDDASHDSVFYEKVAKLTQE